MATNIFPAGGRFNRRIAFEVKSTTVDTFGQPVDSWTELSRCSAEITPYVGIISGFSPKPAQEAAVAPVTITVRYNAGRSVTAKMRIRELTTNVLYDVLYVSDPESAQRLIQMACQVAI